MRRSIFFYALIVGIFSSVVIYCSKEEKPPDPVTDIEGNTYQTVRIGNQVWMAENLRTTIFSDGSEIPLVADSISWLNLEGPGFCWYKNDKIAYKDTYGALYNSYIVDSGKLCPDGWHIPSKEEIKILIDFLGDSLTAGGKLKEAGTDHWKSPNTGADNSTGFNALPAGIRYFEGSYTSAFTYTALWTATGAGEKNAWFLGLYFGDSSVKLDNRSKNHGFSVRCIKD